MDIFKFISPIHPMRLDQGQVINGLKTKMWVERYNNAGSFEFTARLDRMAHKQLPLGTLISHVDSTTVMVVENHEITETRGKPVEVKITGRSFETYLENRVVGINTNWATEILGGRTQHILSAESSWLQIVRLIRAYIDPNFVYDPGDALSYYTLSTSVSGTGEALERSISKGNLYARVLELMYFDDLGIRTIRPNLDSPLGPTSPNLTIQIYKGEDLSNDIYFSHVTGELESSDYIWSNKKVKNSALVSGYNVQTIIYLGPTGYDRRIIHVDAPDIDDKFAYDSSQDGNNFQEIIEKLRARGLAVLMAQKEVALIKAEIAKNSSSYRYREDYNLGDVVMVSGSYNETAKMRVTEHVEIEDEYSSSAYPTLSVV